MEIVDRFSRSALHGTRQRKPIYLEPETIEAARGQVKAVQTRRATIRWPGGDFG